MGNMSEVRRAVRNVTASLSGYGACEFRTMRDYLVVGTWPDGYEVVLTCDRFSYALRKAKQLLLQANSGYVDVYIIRSKDGAHLGQINPRRGAFCPIEWV